MRNKTNLTDEQLVAAYAAGDNAAFDELLERRKAQLYTYITSRVKDHDLADDVFQETFVKAIVTIRQDRYSDQGKFLAWLFRIARNLIIDIYRQDKTEAAVSTDDPDFGLLNRRELSEGTIEDEMIDLQIETDVRRLIEELPEAQKEVLTMRFYKELSFKEIAELTGVSINTALGRMRYAILNLRRIAKERSLILTK